MRESIGPVNVDSRVRGNDDEDITARRAGDNVNVDSRVRGNDDGV